MINYALIPLLEDDGSLEVLIIKDWNENSLIFKMLSSNGLEKEDLIYSLKMIERCWHTKQNFINRKYNILGIKVLVLRFKISIAFFFFFFKHTR